MRRISVWMVVLVGLFGCDEEQCPTGEACDKACQPGEGALCVAEGICSCVPGGMLPDGGVGGAGGGAGGANGCAAAAPGDLVINEVMIDGEGADDPTEFIELVNTRDTPVSLRGIKITSNKGEDQADRVLFSGGCMPAHGAVAMFHEEAAWIWEPVPEPRPTFEIKAYAFSNSADIAFEIRDAAGVEIDRAFGAAALIDEGISATRSPQLTGPLAPHVEVSPTGAKLSPARCANGGTFAMSCNDGNGGMGGMGGMGGAGGMGGGMPPACDPPGVDELVINEVLIDGLAPEETTEFIELVNTAARPVAVAGLSIHSTSGASLRERVRLTGGCLPARSAIAIFRDGHSLSHPEELAPITYSDISYGFSNSGAFTFELRGPAMEVLNTFSGTGSEDSDGESVTRNPELLGGAVGHLDVSVDRASPARCANGGTFAAFCEDGGMGGAGGMGGMGGAGGMGGMGGAGGVMPDPCRPAGQGDLRINEAFIDPVGSDTGVEFVEIVNTAGEPIDLAGIILQTNNSGGAPTDRITFRGGCLAVDGSLLIRGPAAGWVLDPAPVRPLDTTGSLSLVNSADVLLRLVRNGQEVDTLAAARALIIEGESINRSPDLAAPVARHTEVAPGVLNSPGTCANGRRFADGCQAQ